MYWNENVTPTKAVAVIREGGFLAESAPVVKPRGKPVMILLTDKQRRRLDNFIDSEDYQWQGKYEGMLPWGWTEPEKKPGRHVKWYTAHSAWFDVVELLSWLHKKVDAMPDKDLITIGADLVIHLLAEAAKLSPAEEAKRLLQPA